MFAKTTKSIAHVGSRFQACNLPPPSPPPPSPPLPFADKWARAHRCLRQLETFLTLARPYFRGKKVGRLEPAPQTLVLKRNASRALCAAQGNQHRKEGLLGYIVNVLWRRVGSQVYDILDDRLCHLFCNYEASIAAVSHVANSKDGQSCAREGRRLQSVVDDDKSSCVELVLADEICVGFDASAIYNQAHVCDCLWGGRCNIDVGTATP